MYRNHKMPKIWSVDSQEQILATICHILRLKCTIFDFVSAPDPAGRLTALAHNKHLKYMINTEPGTIGQFQTNEVLLPHQKGQQAQNIVCNTKSSYF